MEDHVIEIIHYSQPQQDPNTLRINSLRFRRFKRMCGYAFPCLCRRCDCLHGIVDLCNYDLYQIIHQENKSIIHYQERSSGVTIPSGFTNTGDVACYQYFYYLDSIIFSVVLGALLTIGTLHFQEKYGWTHHQTIGLAFLFGFTPCMVCNITWFIYPCSRFPIRRPVVLKNLCYLTFRGLKIVFYCGIFLSIGALTAYIFKRDMLHVNDDGSIEAADYAEMGIFGFLVCGVVLVLWNLCRLGVGRCRSFYHQAYQYAIQDERITLDNLQRFTALETNCALLTLEYY